MGRVTTLQSTTALEVLSKQVPLLKLFTVLSAIFEDKSALEEHEIHSVLYN